MSITGHLGRASRRRLSVWGGFKPPLGVLAPWMDRYAQDLESPVLEIGAGPPGKRCKDTRNYRPDLKWVGTDLESGRYVDFVHDMEDPIPGVVGRFRGCVCLEVLEHVYRPWLLLKNVHDVLEPGSRIIITTLFHWEKHNHPEDYWRFTDTCLARLMEDAGYTGIETRMGFNPSEPKCKVPHTSWVAARA